MRKFTPVETGMSCIYSHSIHRFKSHPSWQQFKHPIAPGLLIKLRFSRSLIVSSLSIQLHNQSNTSFASCVHSLNSPRLTKPKCAVQARLPGQQVRVSRGTVFKDRYPSSDDQYVQDSVWMSHFQNDQIFGKE